MLIIAEVRTGWEDYATDPFWSEPNTIPNFRHDIRGKTPEQWADEVVLAIIDFFNNCTTWNPEKDLNWCVQQAGMDHSTPVTDDYGFWVLQCPQDWLSTRIDPPGNVDYVGVFHDIALRKQGVTLLVEA